MLTEMIDKVGRTPLHIAAKLGYVAIVELLWSKGCNLESVDVNGWTALHYAAFEGKEGESVI